MLSVRADFFFFLSLVTKKTDAFRCKDGWMIVCCHGVRGTEQRHDARLSDLLLWKTSGHMSQGQLGDKRVYVPQKKLVLKIIVSWDAPLVLLLIFKTTGQCDLQIPAG